MAKRDESKLPKWARDKLHQARHTIELLHGLREAHSLLTEPARDWFTIPNTRDETMRLWLLYSDSPFPVCSLAPGDTLLVGRAKRWIPEPAQSEVDPAEAAIPKEGENETQS